MITSVQMGLAEWSRSELAARRPNADVEDQKGDPYDDPIRIPFIEPDEGPPMMTNAATSTASWMRMFICYSTAAEATGSNHLPMFDAYYYEVCRYLLEKPGHRGKKLAKIVTRVPQMIISHPKKMWVPMTQLPTEGMINPPCSIRLVTDELCAACIAEDLGIPWPSPDEVSLTTEEEAEGMDLRAKVTKSMLALIGDEIFSGHDRLGPVLRKLYDHWKAVPIYPDSRDILDAITHLQAPGSVEGYSRSCLGTLSATGYVSKEHRMLKEGIDSGVKEVAEDITLEERELYKEVINLLVVPSVEELERDLIQVSTSKGAGNDSVKAMGVTRNTTLGEELGNIATGGDKINVKNTKKDAVIAMAGDEIMKILDELSTLNYPLQTGLRSVAARILRFIYSVPINHQILLRPFYKAFGKMMKSHRRYALKHADGPPVKVRLDYINRSIATVLHENLGVIADDASKLDQHKGPRHHEALYGILYEKGRALGTGDVQGFGARYGKNYYTLLADVIRSWNQSYFVHKVDPENGINVTMITDTDPSGALTTAEDNTLTAEAVLRQMQKHTGEPADTERSLWGDDASCVVTIPAGLYGAIHFPKRIREREEVGKRCGQMYDTIGGAQNGRMVHFLQVLYKGGQIMQRRMPIDAENSCRPAHTEIGSLLDKYTALTQRGGNLALSNMLLLSTIVQGSRMKVYGKQAVLDFDTFAAPGGLTNRVMVGYPSPNSRLWLSLNWPWIRKVSDGDDLISARPRIDRMDQVGARMLSDDMMIQTSVGTAEGKRESLGTRIASVEASLLDPERMRVSDQAMSQLGAAAETISGYGDWVRRSGEQAMGLAAVERVFKKEFREKALVKAGYINKYRTDTTPPARKVERVSEYDGVKIGSSRLYFRMSRKHHIRMKRWSNRQHGRFRWRFIVCGTDFEPYDVPFKWHPYWSRGMHTQLLLAFCGVHGDKSGVGIRDLKQAFSTSKFRPDVNADEVISALARNPGKETLVLNAFGFSADEAKKVSMHVPKIGLYEDLADADEYVGLDDLLQSIHVEEINRILTLVAPTVAIQPEPMFKRALYTHFLSLLVDEFNMACSLTARWDELTIRLPIPSMSK
jgi:hypothetical protein